MGVMRRILACLAVASVVAACANPVDLLPDYPDTGADAGADVTAPKDSGKDTSAPVDAGKDSSVSDSGSDATASDAGTDATLDAAADSSVDASVDATVDASDGGVDASDGGSLVDGGTGNDTCAQSVTLVNGTMISGDTTNETDDYQVNVNISSVCDNSSSLGLYTYDGNDVAYTITVPNTKTLTVDVNPTSSWDPAIAIVSSCASVGPSCLGGADEGFSGDPETATYTNTTGSDQVVFIIVDSYSTSEMGPFTIQATLQ
jgi:hypothetical protein